MCDQIVVPLRSQQELEDAIILVDRNERMRSLRLRLTKENDSLPPGRLGELFGDRSTVSGTEKGRVCWVRGLGVGLGEGRGRVFV